MIDLTINKGLVDSQGKVINGMYISNLTPKKIIYTGDDESEIKSIKGWANKIGATFEQKKATSKPLKKFESTSKPEQINKDDSTDKTEPTVEELFPEYIKY